MSAFDQIREAYFGNTRLPGRLSRDALRRVLLVSIVPGVVLAASVLHATLHVIYWNNDLSLREGFPGGAPLIWQRADAAAEGLAEFAFLAVALLLAAGFRRWTRSEGSWMLLIGIVLAGASLALAIFVVGGLALFSPTDNMTDLKTYVWEQMGTSFAALAAGYFFLAYRATQPTRTITRRRPPRRPQSPPPGLT